MGNPYVKPPCTFSKMTPEQRAECGRKGAEVTKRKVRERKAMKETLEILLNMPMKKGKVYTAEEIKSFADLKGKNITIDQAMSVCLIQKALKGDLSAIAMVRDTIGEKPVENVKVDANVTKNPFDELTADELRKMFEKETQKKKSVKGTKKKK